jgi:hypothetical protein
MISCCKRQEIFYNKKIKFMQVKFLKDHLKNKAGDVAFVTDERANYFQRHKVATIVSGDAEVKSENKNPNSESKTRTPKKAASKKSAKKSAKK